MLENKSSARPNVGSLSLALFAFPSWPVSRCPVSPGETTPLKKAPGAKAKTRSHHRSAVQRTVLYIVHATSGWSQDPHSPPPLTVLLCSALPKTPFPNARAPPDKAPGHIPS